MPIYMIRAGTEGLVKIGRAQDPEQREGPSKAGPNTIGVVSATPESIENERTSHG